VSLRLPLAQLVGAGPFEIPLVAPCGHEYLHIAGVDVWQAEEIVTVDAKGVRTTEQRNPGRGSVVTIRLWCEDGHDSRVALRFHKGQTYLEATRCALSGEPIDARGELWRD
jgi:hypothetical protein